MALEEALTFTVNWKEDDETDAPYQLKYDILKFAYKEEENSRNTSARVAEFQTEIF
jgi:hypothetical protein